MRAARPMQTLIALLSLTAAVACGAKKPPIARPMPPPVPPANTAAPSRPPAPPEPVVEPIIVPPEPVKDDAISAASLDDLNRSSPLKAVFYELDSNAALLKRYPSWTVTVEGHCDERGTAEYNLALGERRAITARAYLVSLGIPADRLRTVSYGKEFPFDPGHDEAAFAKNRRAHFVITAK